MNIQELSVGDWVRIYVANEERYCKVDEIRWNNILGKYVCEVCDRTFSLSEAYLHPIPLTPEILEKNGFEFIDDGNDAIIFLCCDMFWARLCVGDCFWSIGVHSEDRFDAVTCNVKYVHQLQHALRLAGIEKEIVL